MIPELNEEDMALFDTVLHDLLEKSEATVALLVERAGYLIRQAGEQAGLEPVSVATLVSNAFAATEFMANLIQESDFPGMYQQGATTSTLTLNIDASCLLFIAFPSQLGVGAIKYYAADAVRNLAGQLEIARKRGGKGLDLADLNPNDAREIFRKEQ